MFRVQAKHLFLTYPQCDVEHQDLYDYLLNLPIGNLLPEKLCLAKEAHQDGHTHYHAYVGFGSTRHIRNQAAFDFNGYHPNVQSARSYKSVLKYVTKDNNYIANFDLKIKVPMREIMVRANDEEEFINMGLAEFDFKFAACYSQLVSCYRAMKKLNRVCDPVRSLADFKNVPIDLLCAATSIISHERGSNGSSSERTKSLWLYGSTRLGKSQFARALGRHCYMQSIWCVDLMSDDADYLVLDDLHWDSWKYQYKSLLGCQTDVVFTGKYARPTKYKFGIPTIVITNDLPVFTIEEKSWIDVNVTFVYISNKLY